MASVIVPFPEVIVLPMVLIGSVDLVRFVHDR
ncbi:hypothetical protein BRC2024_HCTLARHO_CDS_0022 [Acinetobacter phage vB_AbaS_Silvergun]